MRPGDGHGGHVTSVDVARRDGREHVVADEASGARGAEACHYGRGHVTAVEDVASLELAAQMAASDVFAEQCGRGHGTTAEVVASEKVATQDGHGGCHIKRMRLLDGRLATAASDAAGRARKLTQGSFCGAVTWPRSLFASVDKAGAT